ncbi:MAG TPA: hypothetical protein DEB17_11020 [Chlorobaculum sp.]|uniref:Uncharacterized protein n=2 Tax=Chlorobaculum tepidum TaxID=1097 RepID=Q8KCK2_CHLTE|nr:hypothetical protein CT1413 [Chlorobaculum tepidum TLS]HBU24500.1 hypothetical protein [Chlorobaculum sp.]
MITFIDHVTAMKELSRKFSADEPDAPNSPGRLISRPVRDSRPAFQDLRFIVKESLNLGFRFFDEVDRMLQKFKGEEPEKQNSEEKADDPS